MVNNTNTYLYHLDNLNSQYQKVNYGLATDKALEFGSDNSIKFNSILTIESNINSYESIQRQITYSNSFNTSSDTTTGSVKNEVDYIKVELLKATNGTSSVEDKKIIANNLETVKEDLLNLVNEEVDGQYLYSGENVNQQPFIEDPITGKVTYTSTYSDKKLLVEENHYTQQGVNGIDLMFYTNETYETGQTMSFEEDQVIIDEAGNQWMFIDHDGDGIVDKDKIFEDGDSSKASMDVTSTGTPPVYTTTTTVGANKIFDVKNNLFDDLDEIIAALNGEDINGNPISEDVANTILSSNLEKIDKAYSQVNQAHAKVGTRNNTINNYEDRINAKLTNLNVYYEENATADLTKLAVEAQSLELTYQTLYSTIGKVNELSLVNYI